MERNPEGKNKELLAGRNNQFSRSITDQDHLSYDKNFLGGDAEETRKLTVNICISGEDEEKKRRSDEKNEFEEEEEEEEVKYLEEFGLLSKEKPMITFSHVSSVTENEKINFDVIRKSNSRSESPLLEVPPLKIKQNEPLRPPL